MFLLLVQQPPQAITPLCYCSDMCVGELEVIQLWPNYNGNIRAFYSHCIQVSVSQLQLISRLGLFNTQQTLYFISKLFTIILLMKLLQTSCVVFSGNFQISLSATTDILEIKNFLSHLVLYWKMGKCHHKKYTIDIWFLLITSKYYNIFNVILRKKLPQCSFVQ